MIKFSDVFYVDYIIKCPYNSKRNEINLQDIKLITISHLNEKTNISFDEIDKFNKQRNIISSFMDLKNHNLNFIKPLEEKLNNSILLIKKDHSNHYNLGTTDNLGENIKRIELPKIGNRKSKKFKKINFNSSNETSNHGNKSNNKEESKIKKYDYDDDDDNNSKDNSHKVDNYLNDSYLFNKNIKDTNINTIGKIYNDYNVNDLNRGTNIGSDNEILKSYKDKQKSPSTAATDKTYYNNGINNINLKKLYIDNELGRDLYNLRYFLDI